MRKNGPGTYEIDIRETVKLSQHQLPIEEIEEMELIPQVEVEDRGGEIAITGSLYLYGNYRGNQEAGKLETHEELPESYEESVQFEPLSAQRGPFSPLARNDRFEYRIPVQISLPRGKVREVDDVYAYISTFDYELKTPYQIDLLASLAISGLNEEEPIAQPVSYPNQFEFVHVAGEQNLPPNDSFTERLEAIEQALINHEAEINPSPPEQPREYGDIPYVQEQSREYGDIPYVQEPQKPFGEIDLQYGSDRNIDENKTEWFGSLDRPIENDTAPVAAQNTEDWSVPQSTDEDRVDQTPAVLEEEDRQPEGNESLDNVIPLPLATDENRPAEEESAEEETDEDSVEDVRVAISNKGNKQDQEPISSLASIFARIPKKEERDTVRAEQAVPERSESQSDGKEEHEALYLTNFMGSQEEQFTKVRICILQKNESIDEVADRYNLSVETILKANGTARNQVAAGQALYIPVKG